MAHRTSRPVFGSAIMRRLYLQIYATILGSLLLLVFLLGLAWETVGRERVSQDILDSVSRFVALTLPAADASPRELRSTIESLGQELDIALVLFSVEGEEVAVFGRPELPPARHAGKSGWFRGKNGPILSLVLPDGRLLVADAQRPGARAPFVGLLFLLAIVAIVVAVAVYPISRRLTRRLETLQKGVERIGSGALNTRVSVEGRDEVARLAESFNAAATRIEQLVAAHRLLLANASHELRTPLSRIRLGLELEQAAPSEKQRSSLKQDIAELNTLIDEILVMSRLDADLPPEHTEPVDLLGLAAEECARFDNCTLSGSAPEFTGDPRLLHRMVRNMLENAFKHGRPPVTVRLDATPDLVSLVVSDAGDGIAEIDRERVFQPFYRGSDKQNVEGYGLGLPLVRKIAEAHGGKANVMDGTKSSSAIRVTIPLRPAP